MSSLRVSHIFNFDSLSKSFRQLYGQHTPVILQPKFPSPRSLVRYGIINMKSIEEIVCQ